MDVKKDTRSYDWFKFVVAVILALIALWLLLRAQKQPEAPAAVATAVPTEAAAPTAVPTKAPTEVKISLPEFPKANFQWKFDADRKVLLNPDGQALYKLDADAGRWVPIIPDALRAELPDGFKVAEADGGWEITGPDGAALYRWNPDTFSWEPVEIAPALDLPEFPKADFQWQFDADRNVLLNPDGQAIYELDADTGRWMPIIPDALRAELPDGFKMAEVDGVWQITDADGNVLYRWNPDTFSWEPVEAAPTVNVPEFPTAGQWQFDADQGVLLNADGQAVYELDAAAGRWIPIIPDALRAQLPEGYKLVNVDGVWQITDADGKVLYRWNPETSTWEPVETEEGTTSEAPSSDCGAQPARLSVGDSAKVLTNLNLRTSPGIHDNWLLTMPAGTVVEVIGGPECEPYGDGAYRWWNVKLSDGTTGWAAEAPIHGDYYFLEPVK